MEKRTITRKAARQARLLQHGANFLCYARIAGGPLIGSYIASHGEYRSLKMGALIGTLAATDALDGAMARRAEELDPSVATQHGGWLDQMSDKVFSHSILGGMVVNAARQGDAGLAVMLGTDQVVQLVRDVFVTGERRKAANYNVSTNAQRAGKNKTVLQSASMATMASPLARNTEAGVFVAAAGITASSALAISSGLSLVHKLRAGIADAQLRDSDVPIMPLVDTTAAPGPITDSSALQ
jgi:phosphatidylglycerophosphate synthase